MLDHQLVRLTARLSEAMTTDATPGEIPAHPVCGVLATADGWLDLLDAEDVWCSPVLMLEELSAARPSERST